MAEHDLDAFVYATFDHPPAVIADDVETNPAPNDRYALGDNRSLSPLTGFPALTVPAGFTDDGLPVGLEFLGRPFTEAMLLGFGYAYEQATNHRRPPPHRPAPRTLTRMSCTTILCMCQNNAHPRGVNVEDSLRR